nr:unnamed protein product [Digitaria exilis]
MGRPVYVAPDVAERDRLRRRRRRGEDGAIRHRGATWSPRGVGSASVRECLGPGGEMYAMSDRRRMVLRCVVREYEERWREGCGGVTRRGRSREGGQLSVLDPARAVGMASWTRSISTCAAPWLELRGEWRSSGILRGGPKGRGQGRESRRGGEGGRDGS